MATPADPSLNKALPTIALTDYQYNYTLGLYLQVLEDPTGSLSLAQATNPQYDSLFRWSTKAIPNFGYSSSDFWFRLKVRNAATKPHTYWLLEVAYPLTDYLEVYIFNQDGTYQVKRAGDLIPFRQREVAYQNFVFGLDLYDPQVKTIYLHASGYSSKQFPMYIWEGKHFFEQQHRRDVTWGLYFGALLVMILYNLFLFFSIRHITYLYYVLYISGFMMIQLCLSGYAYQFLWPDWPWFANISNIVFVGLTLFFGMLFSVSLLNIRRILPKAFRLMMALAGMGLALTFATLAGFLDFPTRLAAVLALICSVSLFIIGLLMLGKGYRPARFYMIAWTALLLSLIIYISKNAGLLPNNAFTEHSIQIGSVMEVILLSLGLGDSINSMKREREKAQMEVILALQENERMKDVINQDLERKVFERTQEIRKQKEELEVLNATKDKFFSIVAHDLKGPLNSMTGFFDLLANHADALSSTEIQAIASNLGRSVENTTRLTDNLLTWAMAQMNTLKHQPKRISVNRIVRQKIALFKDAALKKQIILQTNLEPRLIAFVDENHFRFVLRNLISNALKFTKPGGTITLSAGSEEGMVKVSVTDDGVGMDEEVLGKIFRIDSKHTSEGTAGEKGTGLGLLLCKEFIERNGGQLQASSQRGKGSTFTFAVKMGLVEKKNLV